MLYQVKKQKSNFLNSRVNIKKPPGITNRKTEPILLVKNLKRELFLDGVKVKKAATWLQALET